MKRIIVISLLIFVGCNEEDPVRSNLEFEPTYKAAVVSGNFQRAPIGSFISDPVVIEVKTISGSPLEGASITFASESSNQFEHDTLLTDVDGLVSFKFSVTSEYENKILAHIKKRDGSDAEESPITITAYSQYVYSQPVERSDGWLTSSILNIIWPGTCTA